MCTSLAPDSAIYFRCSDAPNRYKFICSTAAHACVCAGSTSASFRHHYCRASPHLLLSVLRPSRDATSFCAGFTATQVLNHALSHGTVCSSISCSSVHPKFERTLIFLTMWVSTLYRWCRWSSAALADAPRPRTHARLYVEKPIAA